MSQPRYESSQLTLQQIQQIGYVERRVTIALRWDDTLPRMLNCPLYTASCLIQLSLCSNRFPRQLPKEHGGIYQNFKIVKDWQIDYKGPFPPNEVFKYVLICVDTMSGLTQAFSCYQATNIRALGKQVPLYRHPHGIESDQASYFKGHGVQDWPKVHNTEWRFPLCYNPQASGLIKRKNGILQQEIKLVTDTTTLALWTNVLSQAFTHLDDQPVEPTTLDARLEPLPRHSTL